MRASLWATDTSKEGGTHLPRLCSPSDRGLRELRRANQGCEMGIDVRQHLAVHVASASCHGVLKDRRYGVVRRAVAVLLPQAIEDIKARRSERATRVPKAPKIVGRPPAIAPPLLLEVPAQLGQ